MKILKFLCFTLAILIFLSSCINEEDKKEIENSASAFDIKQGEASIKQSNQRYMKAFKASDSLEIANCFAKEGKLMISDTPAIEGRDEIMKYFSAMMRNGVTSFEIKSNKISGDSSLLAEEGTYEIADNKGRKVDKGKYIVLWKPEGGNWKMYRDMYTSDLKDQEPVGNRNDLNRSRK